MMEIVREFTIEAAHRLPNVPEGHKCARLHGHSFRIEICLEGEPEPERGWVMDFFDVDRVFQPLFECLDHHYLNEVEGLENPTSENLARWIWQRLVSKLPGLSKITVRETCSTACVYRGHSPLPSLKDGEAL